MFGGCGLYVDDLFVALLTDDCLYLKTDAQTRASFEGAGCTPFVYRSRGRDVALSYYTVPDDAMESPMQMQEWARRALAAAVRARAPEPPKARTAAPRRATLKRRRAP
jgi:DNA transformation protein